MPIKEQQYDVVTESRLTEKRNPNEPNLKLVFNDKTPDWGLSMFQGLGRCAKKTGAPNKGGDSKKDLANMSKRYN